LGPTAAYMTLSYFRMDRTTPPPYPLYESTSLTYGPQFLLSSLAVFSVTASSPTSTATKWPPAAVVPISHDRAELLCDHGGVELLGTTGNGRAAASATGTAMLARPPPKRREKKGHPSLLDLQKWSLRLEKQLCTRPRQIPRGIESDSAQIAVAASTTCPGRRLPDSPTPPPAG